MTHYPPAVNASPGYELVPLRELRSNVPNLMLPGKIDAFVRSMRRGASFPPIDIDRDGNIIDGHHRREASLAAGFTHIPAYRHQGGRHGRFVKLNRDGLPTNEYYAEPV